MPVLLIRHRVADYPAWKANFDAEAIVRRANGSRGGWLFRDAADPGAVLVLLTWDDLDRARWFADSDDLRVALARPEVVGTAECWVLEEAEQPEV